ncbi:MAG: response regulator [Desulfuromonadaceae bacterium]
MGQKVLVVDDSNLARMMMRNVINTHFPDVELLEACSGIEATRICADQHPDVALLDYNMPDTNGLDLALELMHAHPDMAMFLVTANVQEATRQRAEAAGVGFITKPVDVGQLEPILTRG